VEQAPAVEPVLVQVPAGTQTARLVDASQVPRAVSIASTPVLT